MQHHQFASETNYNYYDRVIKETDRLKDTAKEIVFLENALQSIQENQSNSWLLYEERFTEQFGVLAMAEEGARDRLVKMFEDEIREISDRIKNQIRIRRELLNNTAIKKNISNNVEIASKISSWDEISVVEIIDGIKVIFHIKNKRPVEMMPNNMPHCSKKKMTRWGHFLELLYIPDSTKINSAQKQRVNESILKFFGLPKNHEAPFRPDGTMVFPFKCERQFKRSQNRQNGRSMSQWDDSEN